jgi:starvation-inducible DNA-binding protein
MAFEISSGGTQGTSNPFAANDARGTERLISQLPTVGALADTRIALGRKARAESAAVLKQILANTLTLRDLYKKHHWQTSGPTFYQLHLLFDKHHGEQQKLADAIGERIEILGGVSIAMAAHVVEMTTIARAPRDREAPALQLARLGDAHERVLYGVRAAARRASELGDEGTNDLLVSDVIRVNEKQAWFIWEQSQR